MRLNGTSSTSQVREPHFLSGLISNDGQFAKGKISGSTLMLFFATLTFVDKLYQYVGRLAPFNQIFAEAGKTAA